jgi:hypothetical protein
MQNIKAARRAAKHEPRLYEQWGLEEPRYTSNVHELYRHEVGLLNRYIIPPADVIDQRRRKAHKPLLGNTAYELLRYGWTVLDTAILLAVLAFMVPFALYLVGPATDACIASLGW